MCCIRLQTIAIVFAFSVASMTSGLRSGDACSREAADAEESSHGISLIQTHLHLSSELWTTRAGIASPSSLPVPKPSAATATVHADGQEGSHAWDEHGADVLRAMQTNSTVSRAQGAEHVAFGHGGNAIKAHADPYERAAISGTIVFTGEPLRTVTFFGFFMFIVLGFADLGRFLSSPASASAAALLGSAEGASQTPTKPVNEDDEACEWSVCGLIALTSYRFYTGFLSATWLPYLLAMEGADLYRDNQSLFMGVAKLIYGLTILFNPLFGLIGDRAVAISHGISRRLFLRLGISLAGLGCLICWLADQYNFFYSFVVGIFLWRVGEAFNDVTTEALVPELVPQKQYPVASAIKAASFLFGGVFAYVLLIFMTEYHYTWLYWAYGFGMLIFALPCQLMLWNDLPMIRGSSRQTDPFFTTLRKAYIAPALVEGYFPTACAAIFIFSFGTSPMFFLLLMIRDLVGASTDAMLQQLFSTSSIIFFVCAALATIIGGVMDKLNGQPSGQAAQSGAVSKARSLAILHERMLTVMRAAILYATICLLIPLVSLIPDNRIRIRVFFVLAAFLGWSFGSGFARFQDLTWQTIPEGMEVANFMGFNIMCRLFGVGIGNFLAGLLLDYFMIAEMNTGSSILNTIANFDVTDMAQQTVPIYRPLGYAVMCGFCAIVCLVSAYMCSDMAAGVKRDIGLLSEAPVPAA
jgi:hypothetical protein